ncbi:MAG: hypothetical protein L3J43_10530 [Sulfurovum sp.]|nr:hypothetical protein [Sulfurovum sp.]
MIRLLLLISIVYITGCSYKQYEAKHYRSIPLHTISVKMNKKTILNKLGVPYNTIGSKKYKKGIIEVWEYRKYHESINKSYDPIDEQYWLYFWNGELAQWGRPGDWEKEADRIYEIRMR